MGFPLRSNIFKSGTREQKYFSRFPIQVAVIFSPKDQDFRDAFRSIFLELDKLTGDDVAFFAVLDPPQEWLTEAGNRQWWREYSSHIGQIGFSMDDRVLVKEIARLFSVGWGELPQIVVSTNLWTGEAVKSPTSPFHIQQQLEALTNLVHEWGEPNIGHIAEKLSQVFGVETQYHLPDNTLRYRFSRMYGVLDTLESPDRIERYSRLLQEELFQVENTLRRIRPSVNDRQQSIRERDIDDNLTDAATEAIIEDAAGRLVAPATVAIRMFQQFDHGRAFELADKLEEESLVMIETALRNGIFLENLQNDSLRGFLPLRLGTRGRTNAHWHSSEIDFTPGAQGAWKAFELEINLSLIQAARASISMSMPEFFAIYDSELPKQRSKIPIESRNGRKRHRDINQLDWEAEYTRRQRFLPIGDALEVTQNLSGSSDYEHVISMCLGHSLPLDLFNAWQNIREIRNKGSHVEPLQYRDYRTLLETVLSPDTLDPLITIKSKLSSRAYVSPPAPVISINFDDMRKAESDKREAEALRKAKGYKREIEALRDVDVANQIQGYYQNWLQIQSQEARLLLAEAIVEKVRKAGREKATAERAWYKELWKFLDEAQLSSS